MSFRLSEIRKTKRASHWSKRGPYQHASGPVSAAPPVSSIIDHRSSSSMSLPSLLHDPAFMLPQLGGENLSRTGSTENPAGFPINIPSSISPTDSK